uniref:Uncharacterized protein n=1 Tax=Haptolina brevifila TaxID=156173 RepID=A0A7S2JAS6_9EUKA|eukprot:CAMPEP_0174714396 /NCGR_PEP_ID=MMETSP1094-20130205/17596_1 /TAXON_ID=156173 /ORGANISM="Chrysochromulina brevifilum, Strain UTEX LB 985" /LENGTH=318 /DNA_ID=CAMNT_0015913739 /DNA_START=47 /DNA_END=1003 /DNA_ORIENTATION=-
MADIGTDKKKFLKYCDESRLNMDPKFMIPGKIEGPWAEVQGAVLAPLAAWAAGLTGKFGNGPLKNAFCWPSYWLQDNVRTYGMENEPGVAPAYNVMYVGPNGSGACQNFMGIGLPLSINLISGLIAKQMSGIKYREIYYVPMAIYLVPTPNDDGSLSSSYTMPSSPAELEGSYAWSYSQCIGKSDGAGKKGGAAKGEEVMCSFYEMHLWKFKKVDGVLKGFLCALSEMDGYDQKEDAKGKSLKPEILAALAAFKKYITEKNIQPPGPTPTGPPASAGAPGGTFDAGRKHFLTQKAQIAGGDELGTYKATAEAELATMA